MDESGGRALYVVAIICARAEEEYFWGVPVCHRLHDAGSRYFWYTRNTNRKYGDSK